MQQHIGIRNKKKTHAHAIDLSVLNRMEWILPHRSCAIYDNAAAAILFHCRYNIVVDIVCLNNAAALNQEE